MTLVTCGRRQRPRSWCGAQVNRSHVQLDGSTPQLRCAGWREPRTTRQAVGGPQSLRECGRPSTQSAREPRRPISRSRACSPPAFSRCSPCSPQILTGSTQPQAGMRHKDRPASRRPSCGAGLRLAMQAAGDEGVDHTNRPNMSRHPVVGALVRQTRGEYPLCGKSGSAANDWNWPI
jgi:hypothetical protein